MDENEITYRQEGDVMLPNLDVSEKEKDINLTKFGLMRRRFLRERHPVRYDLLLTQGRLNQHCLEIENQARDMKETVMVQLRQQNQPPAKTDFMANLRYNNQISDMADEIVIQEIVYGK